MTLKTIREEAVLSATEVAILVGVSKSTMSLWENGIRRPSPRHIRKLADVYHLTPQAMKQIIDETMMAQA